MHISNIILAAITLATDSLAQYFPLYTLHVKTTDVIPPEVRTSFVSYANSTIWIGGVKYMYYSEPFSIRGFDSLTFTSYHTVPTGQQNFWIAPNRTKPVELTNPHGALIPDDGIMTGFWFDPWAGHLTWQGANNFWGCDTAKDTTLDTYEIWWIGEKQPDGISCFGPIELYGDFSLTTGD